MFRVTFLESQLNSDYSDSDTDCFGFWRAGTGPWHLDPRVTRKVGPVRKDYES